MTSDSGRYIQLQTVYQNKAGADMDAVRNRVHSLLQDIGRVCVVMSHIEGQCDRVKLGGRVGVKNFWDFFFFLGGGWYVGAVCQD